MKTPLPIVKLLGKNAVITDTICLDGLNKSSDFTEVPENELLPDEVLARLYRLGCYTIRQSYVACKTYPNYYPNREPVDNEVFQRLRKEKDIIIKSLPMQLDSDYRIQTVFSVNYKYICHAQEAYHGWCEGVNEILLVKEKRLTPTPCAVCFIHKLWSGSSSSAEYWYAVYPDGSVMGYCSKDNDENASWEKIDIKL